ncbi:cache domain-containing protein [Aliiruegeria lutimaris]|uniref:histidine kinase n=1 Tax=Aliiruegeria lutimaris TaxID=571298 RepID=A0A1G9CCH2_9RHOB|nr:cache domain-containing protein [Aliiruegeria lutimaris]SDK49341.1 two-component system, NarL family, sensor kinase [Aliiruegeria lutimaris]
MENKLPEETTFQRLRDRIRLSYAQKIFLLATVPLMLAMAAISVLVALQARSLADREIAELENRLIAAKRTELQNYLALARNAISKDYGRALPDDEAAKERVIQTLAAMIYGQDGYFFVFDYDGNNLVAPRQTELINVNWSGLTDSAGTPIVDELIKIARRGSGYHSYLWHKPSTGDEAQMVSYVVGLQDWRWGLGTGIFIDDILETVTIARSETEARVRETFLWIAGITMIALLLVFFTGLWLNIRERRLADAKLKALTQRIFDTQEEERGRVARELHDSISQILVSVRYTLELARRRLRTGDERAEENLDAGIDALGGAIQEVRRISRDLRPGVLDDLGLGPALQSLIEEFGNRTGLTVEFETVVFRNRLDQDAKISLYRVAQEALMNIERHAEASHVSLRVFGHKGGATLRIADNGRGIAAARAASRQSLGLGLRNMQERIEQLDGTLRIMSTRTGTIIEAQVPLTHMLAPESGTDGPKSGNGTARERKSA